MDAPTVADLKRFAPRAMHGYVDAFVSGWPKLRAAGIDTPLRWSHFVAQCSHETGGLTLVRESTRWSAERMCSLWPRRFRATDPVFRARYALARGDDEKLADLAYGSRSDLGNTEEGDGWAFRGGGLIQITGRSCYRDVGLAIGHDLESSPDLIENPMVSLEAAIHYWSKHKLNRFADQNNIRAIGNQINRGNAFSSHEPIGAADRKRSFDRAWAIWGASGGGLPTTDILDVGSTGAEVTAVQLRLRELRYGVGATDGVFGPETGRAVAAFKADWTRDHEETVESGTAVGPLTRSALAQASPIERIEREQTTAAELRASGSTEMAAGGEMKRVGTATTLIGGAGVAHQAGLLETLQSSVAWLPALQGTAAPALDALRWCATHLPFVALLVIGLLVFYRGEMIERARLLAHRLGFNLAR